MVLLGNYSDRYFKKLDDLNFKYKIIHLPEEIYNYDLEKCFSATRYKQFISNFLDIKISELSISQAYDLLIDLQKKFRKWK